MTRLQVELRGQPFRMLPDLAVDESQPGKTRPSETEFAVLAPGFEDWCTWGNELVLVRKSSGWRAYVRESVTSYSTAFNHGGHTVHYRYHALKDADTGKPLPARPSAEAMLRSVERLFLEGEPLPA